MCGTAALGGGLCLNSSITRRSRFERLTQPLSSWPSPSDAGVRTRGRIPGIFPQPCCIWEFLRRSCVHRFYLSN